jgi:hypothetical protein
MCVVKRELSISFGELDCVEVRCKCGTVVLMSAKGNVRTVSNCPGCGESYGDAFSEALRLFRDAYRLFAIVEADTTKARSVGVRIPFGQD